jgi:predicted transposase/invertase (TIGR01784 family)
MEFGVDGMDDEFKDEKQQRAPVQLNEVAGIVFDCTDPMALDWINGFFKKNYDKKTTKVYEGPKDFVKENMAWIHSDVSGVVEAPEETTYIHMEIENYKHPIMAIRMFDYGYHIAKKFPMFDEEKGLRVYRFPMQVVVYLEENENIGDALVEEFRFPNGESFQYEVPVIKNWKLTPEEIEKRKLYPLMAFQLNNLRQRLRDLKDSDEAGREELVEEILTSAKSDVNMMKKWFLEGKIEMESLLKLLRGSQYMMSHLNSEYLQYEKIDEEATKMTQLVIDESHYERGVEKGIEKGFEKGRAEALNEKTIEFALKSIARGFDNETVSDLTGLSFPEIEN